MKVKKKLKCEENSYLNLSIEDKHQERIINLGSEQTLAFYWHSTNLL